MSFKVWLTDKTSGERIGPVLSCDSSMCHRERIFSARTLAELYDLDFCLADPYLWVSYNPSSDLIKISFFKSRHVCSEGTESEARINSLGYKYNFQELTD